MISKMGRETLSKFCVAEGLIEAGMRVKVKHMVDLICDWVCDSVHPINDMPLFVFA